MPVLVVDYDPSWPMRFEMLRSTYSDRLADAGVPCVSIEHVGSTAVPGLAAKPIIDIDIVVEAHDVAPASAVLVDLGFRPLGELGIPLRAAFAPPDEFADTNTDVTVTGSLALRNHLAVRDTLRADNTLRDEYAAVKKAVGATAFDIYEYGSGKNDMVQRILFATGLTSDELSSIAGNQVTGPEVAYLRDEAVASAGYAYWNDLTTDLAASDSRTAIGTSVRARLHRTGSPRRGMNGRLVAVDLRGGSGSIPEVLAAAVDHSCRKTCIERRSDGGGPERPGGWRGRKGPVADLRRGLR